MDDQENNIIELPDMYPYGLTDEQFERLTEAMTNAANSICDAFAALAERIADALNSIDWETIAKAIKETAEQDDQEHERIDLYGNNTIEPDN